jgi:hypothetical protein
MIRPRSHPTRVFADHIAKDDPATRRVLFDLSFVPMPDETPEESSELTREIRRIGIGRFLFGSDSMTTRPNTRSRICKDLG